MIGWLAMIQDGGLVGYDTWWDESSGGWQVAGSSLGEEGEAGWVP